MKLESELVIVQPECLSQTVVQPKSQPNRTLWHLTVLLLTVLFYFNGIVAKAQGTISFNNGWSGGWRPNVNSPGLQLQPTYYFVPSTAFPTNVSPALPDWITIPTRTLHLTNLSPIFLTNYFPAPSTPPLIFPPLPEPQPEYQPMWILPHGTIFWKNSNNMLAEWNTFASNRLVASYLSGPGNGWNLCGQADFNADGVIDYAFQNETSTMMIWLLAKPAYGRVRWSQNSDVGVATPNIISATNYIQLPRPFQSGWKAKSFNDLNGDGMPDVLLQHRDGRLIVKCLDGTRFLGSAAFPSIPPQGKLGAVADMNGDGVNDLIVEDNQHCAQIWLLDGATVAGKTFVRGRKPIAVGWTIVGALDFDGDGDKDILLMSNSGQVAVWLMNHTEYQQTVLVHKGISAGPGWHIAGAR